MTNATGTLHTEPEGIGGWLVFPMLGTLISPLVALHGIGQIVVAALEGDLITPAFRVFVICETIFLLCVMAGWIVAAVRLFKHKKSFPSLFITMLMVSFLGSLADVFVATSMFGAEPGPDEYKNLVRLLVGLLIWAPYMAKSKRVRNTFIAS